jgi:hypothetical protein
MNTVKTASLIATYKVPNAGRTMNMRNSIRETHLFLPKRAIQYLLTGQPFMI